MISSQLAAQLFSKVATWDILCARGLVWGGASPAIALLRVEVWAWSVHVYLPADPERYDHPEGISIILSHWEYLQWFISYSEVKARKCIAFRVRANIYTVTSSQGQAVKPHTVLLREFGARCDCMLFKCLEKRVESESLYLYSLMQKSEFFCHEDSAPQAVCHHIAAALHLVGFDSLAEYLEERKRRRVRS